MNQIIPRVFFHQSGKAPFAFEVITLDHLFSRREGFDPPLDKPHRVEFFQILYISKGQGSHYIDFKPYPYADGSLLFVSAGQVHAFEIKPETQGFLLMFSEAFLTRNMIHSEFFSYSRLYNTHLHSPEVPSKTQKERVFGPIVKEIYNEYLFSEAFKREEMIRTLLKLLLIKAERAAHALRPEQTNSDWVHRFGQFRRLLSVHYKATRNADAYAQKLGISYNHLNTIVKTITGSTAKAFIDAFVILECKRHLAVSDISVKELTYDPKGEYHAENH